MTVYLVARVSNDEPLEKLNTVNIRFTDTQMMSYDRDVLSAEVAWDYRKAHTLDQNILVIIIPLILPTVKNTIANSIGTVFSFEQIHHFLPFFDKFAGIAFNYTIKENSDFNISNITPDWAEYRGTNCTHFISTPIDNA